jgi:hypothetical protein
MAAIDPLSKDQTRAAFLSSRQVSFERREDGPPSMRDARESDPSTGSG